MAIRLSCQSCNSSFALPELPADRRAACPRCGDIFPIRSFTQEAGGPASWGPSSRAERMATGRWSVQRAVVVSLLMGLVGLLAGLGVYYLRGERRPRTSPVPELPPLVAAQSPTHLLGLFYLAAAAT